MDCQQPACQQRQKLTFFALGKLRKPVLVTHLKRRDIGLVWGFIGVAIFAASLPLTRALLSHLSVLDVAIGRTLLASLAAIGYLFWQRQWRFQHWPSGQLRYDILCGAIGIVFGFPILTAVGMQYAPASHGAIILGCLPLLTAVFAALFNRERPALGFWLISGVGLVLVAAFAVTRGAGDDAHPQWLLGDFAVFGAAVLASMGYALGGKAAQSIDPPQVICWMLVFSLPVQLLLAWGFLDVTSMLTMPPVAWGQLAMLGLGCTLVGFFFWNAGLAVGGVARVSQMQYAQPFLTVLIAVLFLGETFTLTMLGFMLAIIVTIAISRRMRVA